MSNNWFEWSCAFRTLIKIIINTSWLSLETLILKFRHEIFWCTLDAFALRIILITEFIFVNACIGLSPHNIIWIALETFSITGDQTMRQFTWVVSQFVTLLTNFTTSKEILFTTINKTGSRILVIDKRSFATCA